MDRICYLITRIFFFAGIRAPPAAPPVPSPPPPGAPLQTVVDISYEDYDYEVNNFDTEPPLIRLLGSAYVEVLQRGEYGGQGILDLDNFRANLELRVSTIGLV